jgi:hypothetical protein
VADDKITERLLELTEQQLDLLQWFGEWVPGIHNATPETWEYRRRWPPGWREVSDLGVYNEKNYAKAERQFSKPPESCLKKGISIARDLLPYRLLEGTWRCATLTPRGRAALLHHGRPCPDYFESHAPNVFDDVDLRPAVYRGLFEIASMKKGERGLKRGAELPDTPDTWRRMLVQYQEDDYRQKGTLTKAHAYLTQTTGRTALNGSLRMHHNFLTLHLHNQDGSRICEAYFSLEGLADLLTSAGSVPVTLDSYYGKDGMRRSEPAAPPVSMMERMHARLEQATDRTADQIRDLMEFVEGIKMGKRAKEEILHQLKVALDCGDSGHAFAAQQAAEEISATVESMLTIAADRTGITGGTPLAMSSSAILDMKGTITGRLPAGSKTTAEVATEKQEEED